MTKRPEGWQRPRRVSVVVDNPAWIVPYAQTLVDHLNAAGERAAFCSSHDAIGQGDVAFYLGCIHITPVHILRRNQRNLLVHESDLPAGRGFAPLTWQILEGCNTIPICLLEAAEDVDTGPVIYRDSLRFEGHEMLDELREAQGRRTIDLCLRFMHEPVPLVGEPQQGEPSHYRRRTPEDSRLDPDRSIAEQFDLLRVVDNERYPAFFDLHGRRYILKIEKAGSGGEEQ